MLRSAQTGTVVLVLFLGSTRLPGQESNEPKFDQAQMKEWMEKVKQFTEPSEHHKILERFIGKWNTETRFVMGGQTSPPEKGTAEYSWLMDGRWLQSKSTGTLMGKPMESFHLLGYDNFKKSFVTTTVNSIDTAMLHSEGDMDPGGNTLITYGTLDEYLTGEHDKMVKRVWKFESSDKFVLEVHDLPIGMNNTKVIEIIFTRQ